ncbi:MAG: TRAP transporter large permease subunit [Rubrivivax sp.]|nr:TRAP transporter large permease subunit [Rubrivivax sp.]
MFRLRELDLWLAGAALTAMIGVALAEMLLRPTLGRGVDNAPVLVQHLGLVMTMFGALAAERHGHLTSLGPLFSGVGPAAWRLTLGVAARGLASLVCGMLAAASTRFLLTEIEAGQILAYGMPVWWWQVPMPLGFALLSLRLAWQPALPGALRWPLLLALPLAGVALAWMLDGRPAPLALAALIVLGLLAGTPIFAALGAAALLLFASDALPLASVPLSHYQITVNPSLPALPLFTLAGLVFASTGAAARLGHLFQVLFGGGIRGTVVAAAVLCSLFTALTGGSGVTILALGGLLLPLLMKAGYPEQRGIGLVTSASALGVLLAPSVPLIMVAVIARVPIAEMFLAGVLPAMLMVLCLLTLGGFLRPVAARGALPPSAVPPPPPAAPGRLRAALADAKWELAAPLVAVGSLLSGLATPMEGAALTAAYALFTQAIVHRELTLRGFGRCVADVTMIIGGVMLILGMALALTNYLVDAGIPDALTEWVQGFVSNRWLFLLLLCLFLFAAAALMEIYAAIVVLVPLLLPLARAYGIDPLHFGIIFLAAMEVGFLLPPAGMNLYFAASMFGKPIGTVARAVGPAVLAIFVGTFIIALVPPLATALPQLLRAF